MTIHHNGSAEIIRHFSKRGGMFAPYARYSMQNYESMMKNLAEYWNKTYPGSTITDLRIIESATDKPVTYSYKIHVPSFAQTIEDMMAFKSIITPSEEFQTFAQLKTRKYSLNLGASRIIHETTSFTIPQGYKISRIPDSKTYGNDDFKTEIAYRENSSTPQITFSYISRWNQQTINSKSYDEFRKLLLFNSKAENEKIIINRY